LKALLLNSGTGSRLGKLTNKTNKCLVEIADNRTILDEQLTRLINCGITDIIITTGKFSDDLEKYILARYTDVNFTFVNNPMYDKTNYIYSMFLAKDLLKNQDILLMHGDLLFETSVLEDALLSTHSVMVTDKTKPLPPKDFKAVITGEKITRIGVNEFENACYAQPLYKLAAKDWDIWLDEICNFCHAGKTDVYAENAFNDVSHKMNLYPLDINERLCFEVDTIEDLEYAKTTYPQLT